MSFLLMDEIEEVSAIDIDFFMPMDETVEKRRVTYHNFRTPKTKKQSLGFFSESSAKLMLERMVLASFLIASMFILMV